MAEFRSVTTGAKSLLSAVKDFVITWVSSMSNKSVFSNLGVFIAFLVQSVKYSSSDYRQRVYLPAVPNVRDQRHTLVLG